MHMTINKEDFDKDTDQICEEILTTCAVTNLRKLTRLVTNRFNEKIKTTGMRTTQICVMLAIGREAGKALTSYAEELCMDLSTLARSLETLEKQGLVRIKPGRRREKLVYLTETGKEKIHEVYPIWQKAQAGFIKAFGEDAWRHYLDAADSAIS